MSILELLSVKICLVPPNNFRSIAIYQGHLHYSSAQHNLARVGLLMQAGGKWAGKPVLSNDEFRLASLRSSQMLKPEYGYLWWLNKTKRNRFAPADTYAANGALGRRVFVSASEGLVVVRLGDEPGEIGTAGFDREFWRRLMAAKL